jgi:hypothetical protein
MLDLCSIMLDYANYAQFMLDLCSIMLVYARLCSGRFFRRNMLGEYAGMFHEGQVLTVLAIVYAAAVLQ